MERNNEEEVRKLTNRIKRLTGQVASLEKIIVQDDVEKALAMMAAVRSAATAILINYAQLAVNESEDNEEKLRIINRLSSILG